MAAPHNWRHKHLLITGMRLGTLFRVLARNGFHVDLGGLGRLSQLTVLGILNSMFGFCESLVNGRKIRRAKIEHPPLFVLGHWRSGTTHLHNLLSCDENFACPSTFQSCFPHHFILTRPAAGIFDHVAPSTRPMDNMALASHTPHEDEFGVSALSAVSPYMKVLFPVTETGGYSELDPDLIPPMALEDWKEALILFLKKVTLSSPQRLVLKSPPHTARIRILLDLFPKAQFVYIVRNPYMVYASSHKLATDAWTHSHLQIPAPEDIDESILSQYTQLLALYHRDRHLIPSGCLHEMEFEDLERNPTGALQAMYDSLGLPGFEAFSERVSDYLKSIEGYEKNAFHLDEKTRAKVRRRWADTFERHGYTV